MSRSFSSGIDWSWAPPWRLCCVSVAALLLAALLPAQDRRVEPIAIARRQALVVGNSDYRFKQLKNPGNDATAMEDALHKLGFEVRTLRDLDLPHLEAAIDEFTSSLSSGSLGFFYFSGHGVQVNYSNYLLPVDFDASSEADVKYKAYPASRVQDKMEASGARLRILVLDACRNNPYHYGRDASAGLSAMSANVEGTLIAFATGDNNIADDNPAEANGLYTKYLIQRLLTPGLPLNAIFQKAKEDVYRESHRRQNPSIYENIVGEFTPIEKVGGVPSPPPPLDPAAEAWTLIKGSQRPEDFDEFVRAFPNSNLSTAARLQAGLLRRTADRLKPETPDPGATRVNSRDGLTYVWIPAGKFTMGCAPGNTECYDDEKPARSVELTHGFWIGRTEVTQEAWQRVVGTNPSDFKGAHLPVENVSWNEAQTYCGKVGMRLPTEAEWEYAARGAGRTAPSGPVGSVAWYDANSGGKTHEVATRQANAIGLYDVLGNVLEWVADWFDAYPRNPATDPRGPATGEGKVLRGGSWNTVPSQVRLSYRLWLGAESRDSNIGLRCAGEALPATP